MKSELSTHPFVKHLEKELSEKKLGGKISKGENLEGLPFIVLDYPALFNNDNIFCVRTLFWWGNYFSLSLIITGEYFNRFEKNISENINALKKEKVFLLTTNDIWNNNLKSNDFLKTKNQKLRLLRKFISKKHTLKISMKIKFDKQDSLVEHSAKFFDLLNTLLFEKRQD